MKKLNLHTNKQAAESRFFGKGTRKSSVATVWLQKGKGSIVVRSGSEDLSLNDYFKAVSSSLPHVLRALELTNSALSYDILCRVSGGGLQGQVDALKLAIAKALSKVDENFRAILRFNGLLTTDSRKVESKKGGFMKARKQTTYRRR